LKIEPYQIDDTELPHYDFLKNNVGRVFLVGDAVDAMVALDVFPANPPVGELGDFFLYIIVDALKHEKPLKVRLSTFLDSLTVDTTDYSLETDRPDFTQD